MAIRTPLAIGAGKSIVVLFGRNVFVSDGFECHISFSYVRF